MGLPKISVIIPSYNKVKFIGRTLESIFSQKYNNLEVIVQDGASTDGTVKIIEKYADKYPKTLFWESKKDSGQLDAINKGLGHAGGDIVTYINADDCYLYGSFERVADAYQSNPNALWFAGQGLVVDRQGREIAKLASLYKSFWLRLNTYNTLLSFNYLMQPSVFLTMKTYKEFGPFTGTQNFVTEYDLWLKLGKIQMPKVLMTKISEFRIEPSTKTKRMFKNLLLEDEKIVRKYTQNPLILVLHKLHNLGRELVEKFI